MKPAYLSAGVQRQFHGKETLGVSERRIGKSAADVGDDHQHIINGDVVRIDEGVGIGVAVDVSDGEHRDAPAIFDEEVVRGVRGGRSRGKRVEARNDFGRAGGECGWVDKVHIAVRHIRNLDGEGAFGGGPVRIGEGAAEIGDHDQQALNGGIFGVDHRFVFASQ